MSFSLEGVLFLLFSSTKMVGVGIFLYVQYNNIYFVMLSLQYLSGAGVANTMRFSFAPASNKVPGVPNQ